MECILVKEFKSMFKMYFSQDRSWIRIWNISASWVWIRICKLADPRIRIQVENYQPKCTIKIVHFKTQNLIVNGWEIIKAFLLINIYLLDRAPFLHILHYKYKYSLTYCTRSADMLKLYKNEDVSVGTWLAGVSVTRVHDER